MHLLLSAVETSQEGSSREVIEPSVVAGVDIQHIGDAGYGSLATVENIYVSVAIRGVRHTVAHVGSLSDSIR